ncbi:SMP-30/gluconolactonase/LRE family protein [Aquihabitans sp. G128]|uniref:SMP-30/gluconolactonase/LRE family protein n=1 Tax=Aquihabitans sp. G128 TaxID=2849779 RepID=UPI001C2222F6|nr:SMP-30/gluconolactonase/LRE family protein [Aquihabitans sp. G128]QXC63152.1 SMP-30/gluconolactonase/LRE family protein [Aquihabitans sp. G128]
MRRPLRSGIGSRGFLSAGTAAVLVVSSLAMVVGTGFSFGETRLKDGVTWIFDRKKGEAVQVNGSSGKVGARIVMPGTKGEDIVMVQRDGKVWAVDKKSGEAASLDVNDLKVKARTDFGTKDDIQPVMGDEAGFLVNRDDGTVQRIDPQGMESLGKPVSAGTKLSNAVADDAGRLWVGRNATGEVLRIDPDGANGLTIAVRKQLAGKGAQLSISVTDDGIVVTDAKSGKQWRLDADGNEVGDFQAELPAPPPPDVPVTPEYSSGPYVPIVTPDDGGYSVVPPPTQPGGGGQAVDPIPMDDLPTNLPSDALTHPAVTLGDRLYVPVPGESVLIVLDLKGTYLDTIAVPGEGGFQLILDDGHLWVNDPDDPEALRIDADGTVTTVEKSAPDVPITPPKDDPKPPKDDDDKGPKPPHRRRRRPGHHHHHDPPPPRPRRSRPPPSRSPPRPPRSRRSPPPPSRTRTRPGR